MSAPRLSSEAKDAIVAEYASGVPVREIASRYGVHYTYPRVLAKRRNAPAPLHPAKISAREKDDRPLMPLVRDTGKPEWEQILDLFDRHHAQHPPIQLRDELVVMLVWARYAQSNAKAIKRYATASTLDRVKQLEEALSVAALTIQSFDEGDPNTETGWKHDELFEAWRQADTLLNGDSNERA